MEKNVPVEAGSWLQKPDQKGVTKVVISILITIS
jgi:hypothetical protein